MVFKLFESKFVGIVILRLFFVYTHIYVYRVSGNSRDNAQVQIK